MARVGIKQTRRSAEFHESTINKNLTFYLFSVSGQCIELRGTLTSLPCAKLNVQPPNPLVFTDVLLAANNYFFSL